MAHRLVSAIAVAACMLLVNTSYALAQEKADEPKPPKNDPTQIGENAKDLLQPNAKGLWWCALVIGLSCAAASGKRGRAASILGGLAIAGIVIYNPGGVGSFMRGVANEML